MKRFLFIIKFVVFSLILTMSSAQAQDPTIETDKSMHNLDPYYWVYSASQYTWFGVNPNVWPADGHDLSVGFSLDVYEGSAFPLTFLVEGLEGTPVAGSMVEDSGVYRGSFVVSEASVGGELFKPGEVDEDDVSLLPKAVTLTVSDADGTVAQRVVNISRWACDRCHLDQATAREVYSWASPVGGPLGPHNWPHVLGRNGGRPGFTYENLTSDRLTHTPTVGAYVNGVWKPNPLDRAPYHQKTNVKIGGGEACSPCHHGTGHIRHAWSTEGEDFRVSMERSQVVKCVFCHSADSGYVPSRTDKPFWENLMMDGLN